MTSTFSSAIYNLWYKIFYVTWLFPVNLPSINSPSCITQGYDIYRQDISLIKEEKIDSIQYIYMYEFETDKVGLLLRTNQCVSSSRGMLLMPRSK